MNNIPQVLAVFGLGTPEILLILAVVVLLFGATKLPALAKGMGKSIREFKKASSEDSDDEDEDSDEKKPAKKKPAESTKTNGSN